MLIELVFNNLNLKSKVVNQVIKLVYVRMFLYKVKAILRRSLIYKVFFFLVNTLISLVSGVIGDNTVNKSLLECYNCQSDIHLLIETALLFKSP